MRLDTESTLLLYWTNLTITMTVVNRTSRTCILTQIWEDVMVAVTEVNLTKFPLGDINLTLNKVNSTTINSKEVAFLNNNTNSKCQ